MTQGFLFYAPVYSPNSATGGIYPSATLTIYLSGTTTLSPTYTDINLTVPGANPISADSSGTFPPFFLDPGITYRVILKTLAAITVYDQDPYTFSVSPTYVKVAQETSAGITPTNYTYQPGDVRRYGVVGDNSTDDTTAINKALQVGYWGVPIFFQPYMTCIVTNLTLNAASTNVPPLITGNGATLKTKAGGSGTLLTIENPHAVWPAFKITQFVLNGNNLATIGLEVHGSQRGTYSEFDIRGINIGTGLGGQGCGLYLHSDVNFGIYYNRFERIQCGQDSSSGLSSAGACARYGFYEYGPGPQYRNNGNVFIDCYARECGSSGWYVDYAQNAHVNCAAELCLSYGVTVDNTAGMSWYGGYLEANKGTAALTFTAVFVGGETSGTLTTAWNAATSATQYSVTFSNGDVRTVTLTNQATTATWSGGLSSAATVNATIKTIDLHVTANAGGIWWQPDRIVVVADGADNNNWHTSGMMFMGRGSKAMALDYNGRLDVDSLKVRSTGIGLSGANPISNGINATSASDFLLQMSGSTKLLWDSTNNLVRPVVQMATSAGAVFGNAAATIDVTSALEVRSTTLGLLLPRMTTTQRDNITSPTAGLMIYNSTTNKINIRAAAAWEAVTSV